MNFPWKIFIDLGTISIALLLATIIRTRLRFFQRFLIPNALTAGFLLLPFYNFVAPHIGMSSDGLGALVYHLLSLSFISMTLRRGPTPKRRKGRGNYGIVATSVSIIFQYGAQALLGLLLTFMFIKTLYPDLFPTLGFFIPLGFALGPGQAYAIGEGWEAFGFEGAGSVGLTFAAIGFLFACFGGVWLINYGIRKQWIGKEKLEIIKKRGIRTGVYPKAQRRPVGSKLTTESEAIDSLTYNAALVFLVYVVAYLFLKLLTYLLSFAGQLGMDLAVNLWGISFVFAALTALVFKLVLRKLGVFYTVDNGCLTRLAGISVDLMVAGAVGAISIVVVIQYWLPILVMSLLGGFMVIVTVPWFCSRIFTDHRFNRAIIIYGACTGTMPTGLALLRVLDPGFETPVAADYMFSTAITFMICIPFILAINLPAYSYTSGNYLYFWLGVAVAFAYLLFALIAFKLIAKKRAFRRPTRHWLSSKHILKK